MRWWRSFCLVLSAVASCTHPNPAASCTDGTCSDPSYPFCDVDGAIGGEPNSCIAVVCAPGAFGACRGGNVALICNALGDGYDPVQCARQCDMTAGGCHDGCTKHTDCASGVCKADGSCAGDSEIAFTDPAGSPTSNCSRTTPCTLAHALELPAPSTGQYIALSAGQHQASSTLTITGRRTLVGVGPTKSGVQNLGTGPVFTIAAGADSTMESLRITSATEPSGYGVECPSTPVGPRTLTMRDAVVANNSHGGVVADGCTVRLEGSTFSNDCNGAELMNSVVAVDRCTFTGNIDGLNINSSAGLSVTNSMMAHNGNGALLYAVGTAVFEFNTVIDNSTGLQCSGASPISAANNILVRNTSNTVGSNCSLPGSIVSADPSGLRFKSPDAAPFDYHLDSGSIAIDAATNSTVDHDFDGEARPKGGGRDVGADEAQ